jgi:hypothetical protein
MVIPDHQYRMDDSGNNETRRQDNVQQALDDAPGDEYGERGQQDGQ